jgi:chorismate mutase
MTAKKDIQTEIDVAVIKDWRKSVDKNLKDLNKKVDDLPNTLMELLDERYAKKDEVEELKETVEPFTKLRKRIWYLLVGVMVAGALEVLVMVNWFKDLK